MQYHLDVMGKKVRETFAYSDFESLEIYRRPNDELREWIERVSEEFRSLYEMHWGGFTRFSETERARLGSAWPTPCPRRSERHGRARTAVIEDATCRPRRRAGRAAGRRGEDAQPRREEVGESLRRREPSRAPSSHRRHDRIVSVATEALRWRGGVDRVHDARRRAADPADGNRAGRGSPVLLLHGEYRTGFDYLHDLADELARENDVAWYQQRGMEPSAWTGRTRWRRM